MAFDPDNTFTPRLTNAQTAFQIKKSSSSARLKPQVHKVCMKKRPISGKVGLKPIHGKQQELEQVEREIKQLQQEVELQSVVKVPGHNYELAIPCKGVIMS